MNISRFAVGPLSTNCYLVQCEKTTESVIIDPGGMTDALSRAVDSSRLTAVLLTHGHFDHMFEAETIARRYDVPLMVHEYDVALLNDTVLNGSFMVGARLTVGIEPTILAAETIVRFGEYALTTFHTPGHTPGGVSFAGEGCVFAGDTLFRMSVGRWDLPGGDYETLMRSLAAVFLPMDDATVVYPGHGEATTIGFERKHNGFLRDR